MRQSRQVKSLSREGRLRNTGILGCLYVCVCGGGAVSKST